MKVVFDTNVFVSGFLYESGTPAALIKAASDGECELFCSPHILDELRRVLPEKFGLSLVRTEQLVRFVESFSILVYPGESIHAVTADEPDNRILECALEAEADFVVTSDKKHLLGLKHRFPFRIVSPSVFYQVLFSIDE